MIRLYRYLDNRNPVSVHQDLLEGRAYQAG